MEQVGFGFVEGVDALLEIGAMKIDIGHACDMEGFEFTKRTNIEDDEVCLRKQFLDVPGINVLDKDRPRFIRRGSSEGAKSKSECDEGSARNNYSDHNVCWIVRR